MSINIEIKAICRNPVQVREILLSENAFFAGTDTQEDMYFNSMRGRLKLRTGRIENNLIFYNRNNQAGPKQSDFKLVEINNSEGIRELLTEALGILKIVSKSREIYFIDNVKFHIDTLPALGSFVEIEASNFSTHKTVEELRLQCEYYMELLMISTEDLLENSYSDMI